MALDLPEMYARLSQAINAIDEKLDSRDGGTTGLKTKIIKERIDATKPNVDAVLEQIVGQLSTVDQEVQIGFYYGLVRSLDATYGEIAKKFVDDLVENSPKPEPLITEAEVAPLTEKRKEVYAQIKSVMDMAKVFGEDSFATMTPPRRRGGAPKGKRGPRLINLVSWSIDDVDFGTDIKAVVDALPNYDKVKELTDAMKAAKINVTQPPAKIEFTLPDGRVLVGINTVSDDDDDDEDENETTPAEAE